jgi:hypothetical protein
VLRSDGRRSGEKNAISPDIEEDGARVHTHDWTIMVERARVWNGSLREDNGRRE